MTLQFTFLPDVKPLIKATLTNKRFEVLRAVHDIADQVAPAVANAGHTVTCSKGCAHCCHGSSIMVTTVEVKKIEQQTGRKAASNPTKSKNRLGTPCPFLSQ